VLKLIKVQLTDEQFLQLLIFLKGTKVQTLVATNNQLSDQVIRYLLEQE
jgi:hypothetical protein